MTLRFRSDFNSFIFNQSTDGAEPITLTVQHTTIAPIKPTKSLSIHKNGTRKDACMSCFVHNFNFLINNEKICERNGIEIDIVILILTIHQDKEQREAIRNTWLTHTKNNTANIRYGFLLGYTKDKQLSDSVIQEAALHGDIIKEDFIDAYTNLTYKTMMAFRWANEYCSRAKFVMKTDDDMWVNVPNLVESVKKNSETLQKGVGGSCTQRAGPIRDSRSKWYASFKSYPNKEYPGFCAGPGYVTSMAVAKKIFEISEHVPFFHLEDIYVALCIRKLGLRLFALKGYYNYRVRFDPCVYKSPSVVTSHQVPPKLLYNVWNTKCS